MSTIENADARIKEILGAQFCRDAEEIDMAKDLTSAYQCDSLDLLEIVMTVEDEFGFEIPDEACWSIKTGQQIVDYVLAHA